MIIRYHNTLEDLIAFNRYHCAHSPTIKRMRLALLLLAPATLIAGTLSMPNDGGLAFPAIVAAAIIAAVVFCVVLSCLFQKLMDWPVLCMYREGANKGVLGQHELEIDDTGLVERTEVNETRQSWQGIERISETDAHAFLYVSSVMAHVIPKHSVTSGDVDTFIARAKQLWFAANPDLQVKSSA